MRRPKRSIDELSSRYAAAVAQYAERVGYQGCDAPIEEESEELLLKNAKHQIYQEKAVDPAIANAVASYMGVELKPAKEEPVAEQPAETSKAAEPDLQTRIAELIAWEQAPKSVDQLIAALIVASPAFAKEMETATTYADALAIVQRFKVPVSGAGPQMDECNRLINKLVNDGKITSYAQLQNLLASVEPDITIDELKKRVPDLEKREQAIASINALPVGATPSMEQLIAAYGKKGNWGGRDSSTLIMGQIFGVDYSGDRRREAREGVDQSLVRSICEKLQRTEG